MQCDSHRVGTEERVEEILEEPENLETVEMTEVERNRLDLIKSMERVLDLI